MATKYGGGARLKKARMAVGLSQARLASALGISAPYISLIETERQLIS